MEVAPVEMIRERVATLESRVNAIDQRVAAANAVLPMIQEGVKDAKLASERAADQVGHLKHWMLATLGALVVNGALLLLTQRLGGK